MSNSNTELHNQAPSSVVTPKEKLGVTNDEFIEMGRVGGMFYAQGNVEKARTIFEGLVALDPNSAAAQVSLGALLTKTGENEQALIHLTRAIELDANEIAAYVNRAEVLLRLQRGEDAVADLKVAVALDPEEKSPAANRARAMVIGIHDALEAKAVM